MNLPSWAPKYIGIPYLSRGMTWCGADCWGLYYLILTTEFNLALPEVLYDCADDVREVEGKVAEQRPGWREIKTPEPGDLVLFRIAGHPAHVGCAIGDGMMLHSLKGHASALESFQGPKWRSRIEGFFRWA